jgi:prepilin-type N-terminal cleavage/methylation domain-containing protein
MTGRTQPQRGATLVEMLVVLSILGVTLLVTTIAAPRLAVRSASNEDGIRTARQESVRTGQPVIVLLNASGQMRAVTALPDGSIVADTGLGIRRWAGAAR